MKNSQKCDKSIGVNCKSENYEVERLKNYYESKKTSIEGVSTE